MSFPLFLTFTSTMYPQLEETLHALTFTRQKHVTKQCEKITMKEFKTHKRRLVVLEMGKTKMGEL